MIKRLPILLLGLLCLGLISCSGTRPMSQLSIGAWAAEHDLWDEAIFRWTRVIQSSPNSAAAHNNLAVAYEKKGMTAEAGREYELALKLAPSNSYIKENYDRYKQTLETKENKPAKTKPEGEDKIHERL
jgi:tetratricopeptide (TPR) repeat protein